MALTEEWRHRIERWRNVLIENLYYPLGSIEQSGYATTAQLTAEEALAGNFQATPPGTRWGAKWEYAWFKGEITLPEAASGERIVVRLNPGGESLVWINGQVAGSVGWGHKEITLSRKGKPGEHFELLIEAYAGHGKINTGEGPLPFGKESVPEPGPTQTAVGESTYGVWREEAYQLAIDLYTLYELRGKLEPSSLRQADIDQGLMDATLILDLELPEAEMLATVCAARQRLAPLLQCVNGTTAPTLYTFGHAHIDVAWLWPWAETERKMARTVINQLVLFPEYPEFKFLQSQPHLYVMLKERYPELYERFKAAVQAGQVIADGAMWVEADTNISGGESLIRQVVYGRRFFKEELGVDSKVLWLPDVFGYSGALPQILHGCGCIGFATQKITWAYGGGDPFPYNTFLWEGIDGTTIPAHIFYDYNSHTIPSQVIERWNARLQKNGIRSLLLSFGWGDGGGGPTRDHLEFLRREKDLEGMPRLRLSSPEEFFRDLAAQGLPRERYVGELYFQAHRGTYTSQARTKQGNRRSEFALREAELWGSAARALTQYNFNPQTLWPAWKRVMLNQFHDILPGSSIQRVYEEAEAEFTKAIAEANQAAQAAAEALQKSNPSATNPETAVTVFNSLSWPRSVLVEAPGGPVEVQAPPCGWMTVALQHADQPARGHASAGWDATRQCYYLENKRLRAEFNPRGELVSLLDHTSQHEAMAAPGNCFHLYKDIPDNWDAWDLNSMTEQVPVAIDEPVAIEVTSSGPLVVRLRLTRKLHQSTLTQDISLHSGGQRIEFATTIDWQESHKLLKVSFPVNIHANEAIHEIQFGHLRRPNHRSRPFDADRFEVCNNKWSALVEENRGVAILNDSKYGLSVNGNSLNLTLLKSAVAPDMTADRGLQTFTYAIYAWTGSLVESQVVREAYELNTPVLVLPGAGGEKSLFSLDAAHIILETVKPAEDGSPDVIVRLYEAMRSSTHCTLTTTLPVKSVAQTDMLEENPEEIPCAGSQIPLDFRPFEIKTLRLRLE